jgi:prepilin-type N-terminal cleavage/methylation domain-containing protein
MQIYFKYILSSISKRKGLPREAKRSGGFTLIELMVVITIATVIMTALVVQQSSWNDSLAVSTQAYELALMIRQAQIYSLGVREYIPTTGDKTFDTGYGVYFSSENSDDFKRYIFFGDKNKNGEYDAGEQIGDPITFTRGIVTDRFCGVKGNGQLDDRCSPGHGNVSYLQISFLRPEPKAHVILWNGGKQPAQNVIAPATIYLKSPQGKYFYVKVEANGQVSTGPFTS